MTIQSFAERHQIFQLPLNNLWYFIYNEPEQEGDQVIDGPYASAELAENAAKEAYSDYIEFEIGSESVWNLKSFEDDLDLFDLEVFEAKRHLQELMEILSDNPWMTVVFDMDEKIYPMEKLVSYLESLLEKNAAMLITIRG